MGSGYQGPQPGPNGLIASQIRTPADQMYRKIDGSNVPIDIFKNALINGSFDWWQRGSLFTQTGAAAQYSVDRWIIYNFGANGSISASLQSFGTADIASEAINFARVATTGHTGAADGGYFQQPIENVRRFAGKRVAIRGMIRRAAGAGNIAIEISQYFGTGGSSPVNIYAGMITPSTVWTPFQVIVDLPALNSSQTIGTSNFLGLQLYLSAGTNWNARSGNLGLQTITVDFADLEVKEVIKGYGDQVPPFERIPRDIELLRCYRYYEADQIAILGGGLSQQYVATCMPYIVPKRVGPTLSLGASSTFAYAQNFTLRSIGTTHFQAYVQANAQTTYTEAVAPYVAAAEL